MISTRGHVKVADFGLARQTESPQMTATGVLVGTASYLPPELVTHARPDSRSDIYSTGIVLFELLTGKKPHVGENNYQIAYAHVNVDSPPLPRSCASSDFRVSSRTTSMPWWRPAPHATRRLASPMVVNSWTRCVRSAPSW